MKIAMLSPVPNSGTTLSSAMIASAMAMTQDIDTAIMYTAMEARELCSYVGLEYADDLTASITLVHNLILANAIAPEDCREYMHKIIKHLYVLDTTSRTLTYKDRQKIISHIFTSETTPLMICDTSDTHGDVRSELLESADMILICVNANKKNLDAYNKLKERHIIPEEKHCCLLVNMFDERIASIREVATMFGFKLRDTIKVHYNPYIDKYAQKGQLLSVVAEAINNNPTVLELRQDLKEACQLLTVQAQSRFKWED